MSKYDCSKTLDFVHEFTRMCDGGCRACPLQYRKECTLRKVTEKTIAIVQKWSDEHPEKPKLTKKERAFVEGVEAYNGVFIQRSHDGALFLRADITNSVSLDKEWFKFIERDQTMSIFELLVLEVEDE